MPELPELEVMKDNLDRLIKGRRLEALQILKPYIQKTPLPEGLPGQLVTAVSRRGKYIEIDLERHRFIIHLMLSGRLRFSLQNQPVLKSASAVMRFDSGFIQFLEESKLKQMGLWIVPKDIRIDDLKSLGPEPLSPGFTPDRLRSLLAASRERLKLFLVNQANVAGIGNAYSDEICWEAGLSPFKPSSKLTPDEVENVHEAISNVLNHAITETRREAGDVLDIPEKRGFLKVHRHKDEPCPRCGTKIAWVSTTSRNTYYCPGCQAEGKVLKDGRTSKFLK